MNEPHDDLDPVLRRVFAQHPEETGDAAFVAVVARRVATLRRAELAWQATQGAVVVSVVAVLTPWVVQGTLWVADQLAATPFAVVDLLLSPLGALGALAFAGWSVLEGRDALR